MEYITVENNVITGNYCGSVLPDNAIQVENFNGVVGEPLTYYNDDYSRKSDLELYIAGIKTIPTGFKLNDNNSALVEMTQVEKISAGIETIPAGMKLENNQLVSKTTKEQLADNEITQEEYNNYLIDGYKSKLRDTDYIIAKLTEALAINDSDEVAAIESNYAEQLINRKNWRNLINELQEEINQLDSSDGSGD